MKRFSIRLVTAVAHWRSAVVAVVFALLVTSAVWAAAAVVPGLELKTGSRLSLDGTSTVHAWSSTATQLQVAFTHDPAQWPGGQVGLEAVERIMREGAVKALEVTVPVAGMRSGKSGLDKNMQKALKADKHSAITFRLSSYVVSAGPTPEEFTINAKGRLTVAGVERPIELTAAGRRESDGIRLRGKKQLLMTDFEVRPPKMMLGTLRTGDQVTVSFDLLVAPRRAAEAVSTKE